MKRNLIAVLIAITGAVSDAASQNPPDANPSAGEFTAVRVSRPPLIDGDLNDEAWNNVPEISGFIQRDPQEGAPASEVTLVKVVYDDDAIYFGARLDDSKPVTTRLGRRDTQLESDWFRIYIDSHFDRRSGAGFWVNPSNVQLDMVLYNDQWDDPDWDAVWESAAKITATGWNAEVRIPYSQLRFPDRAQHTWGLNLIRTITRSNEYSRLVHVPKTESGFVSRFARLNGISGIKPKRALELMPYGVTRSDLRGTVSPVDPFNSTSEFRGDAGLDVKYGLTSNLTLTGTINPDFGQVEVDPASVNLSVFELFYPEKRPFFVEGANLFEFGSGGSNNNFNINFFQPILFYSRRIGRSPQGTGNLSYDYIDAPGETTILAAGKITGKTGNGWTVAALDAVTDEENAFLSLDGFEDRSAVEPLTNYLVTRMAKDLGSRQQGRVGTLFTAVNRDNPDELSYLRNEAYLGGVDGHWFFGKKDWLLEWYVAGTQVGGSAEAISNTQQSAAHYYQRPDASHVELDEDATSLSGYGGKVALIKQTGKWRFNFQAQSFSPGFETNDIGFLQRADITSTHLVALYDNRQPKGRFRDRGGWMAKWQNWNWDGDLTENGLGGVGYVVLKDYSEGWAEIFLSGERYDDRSTRGGPLMKKPAYVWVGAGATTDTRKKFWVNFKNGHLRTEAGGYEHDYGFGFTFKPTPNLSLQFLPSYNENFNVAQYVSTIVDPDAEATFGRRYIFAEIDQRTLELGTRIDWTPTAKLSLQLYLQPFIASGDYDNFKELEAPKTHDFIHYGASGSIQYNELTNQYTVVGDLLRDTRNAFTFSNPDFNFRSVRGSGVVRWEFRPGSAVYFAWNENRAQVLPFGDFRLRRDISAIPRIESDDVFLIKVSYWLAL